MSLRSTLVGAEALEVAAPKAARAGRAARGRNPPPAEAAAERHRRVAVGVDLAAVEPRALVLVGEQVVGLGHVREALGGLGVVLVAVGMQLLGELAVGGLDVLLARAALNAQGRIRIVPWRVS